MVRKMATTIAAKTEMTRFRILSFPGGSKESGG